MHHIVNVLEIVSQVSMINFTGIPFLLPFVIELFAADCFIMFMSFVTANTEFSRIIWSYTFRGP